MGIKFEKWQGLGNDFVIIKEDILTPEIAKKLCDRRFGIGADGIMAPIKPTDNISDIAWNFYNSDGTIAQMCGNGIRCFAKYVQKHKLIDTSKFKVQTLRGVVIPEILDNGNVIVDMGEPIVEPDKIPVNADNYLDFEVLNHKATAISMGNPHCVIYTNENSEELAKTIGPKIEIDPLFPEKTNVEFVNIIDKNKIKMNVWERGCGITLACGTGACASVVSGVKQNLIERNTQVILPGGILKINYSETDNHVYMEGPAQMSFEGIMEI